MHAASRLSFEGHKCEKKCYWSGQCDLERKLSSLPCHVCFLSLLCVKVVVVDRWQKVRVVCQPLDAFYSYFSERGIEFSTTRSRFYVSRRLFRLISRFVWVKWTHIIECEIFFTTGQFHDVLSVWLYAAGQTDRLTDRYQADYLCYHYGQMTFNLTEGRWHLCHSTDHTCCSISLSLQPSYLSEQTTHYYSRNLTFFQHKSSGRPSSITTNFSSWPFPVFAPSTHCLHVSAFWKNYHPSNVNWSFTYSSLFLPSSHPVPAPQIRFYEFGTV